MSTFNIMKLMCIMHMDLTPDNLTPQMLSAGPLSLSLSRVYNNVVPQHIIAIASNLASTTRKFASIDSICKSLAYSLAAFSALSHALNPNLLRQRKAWKMILYVIKKRCNSLFSFTNL